MSLCLIAIASLFFLRVAKLLSANKRVSAIVPTLAFSVNLSKPPLKKLFLRLCLTAVKFSFKTGCFSKLQWFVLNYEVWREIYGIHCLKMMNRRLSLCPVVRMTWGYLSNNSINVIFLRWARRFTRAKHLNKHKRKHESGNRVYRES